MCPTSSTKVGDGIGLPTSYKWVPRFILHNPFAMEPVVEARRSSEATAIAASDEKKDVLGTTHEEEAPKRRDAFRADDIENVGYAVIEQRDVIPSTGKRKPTTQWEYWTFCIFCESPY